MRRMVRAFIVGSAIAAAGVAVGMALARRSAGAEAGERAGEWWAAPLRPIRSFVTHSFDPLVVRLGLVGGRRSPWALIEHVGRTSGHVYRTPVDPRPMEGGFEIPLAYGADADWVVNLQAAGRARIQLHDTIYEIDRPEIVEGTHAVSLPPPVRGLAGRMGYRYLRVRTVAAMPGTFSHLEGHAARATAGGAVPLEAEGPFAEFVAPVGPGTEVPVEPRMVAPTTTDEPAAEEVGPSGPA